MRRAALVLAAATLACYDPRLPLLDGAGPTVDSGPPPDAQDGAGGECPPVPDCEPIVVLGRCLAFCQMELDFDEAMGQCARGAACLARVTPMESQVLGDFGEYMWIGLRQTAAEPPAGAGDGWIWSCDGAPLDMPFWETSTGEPDDTDGTENCAELTPNGGHWWDKPCVERDWFVCQLP